MEAKTQVITGNFPQRPPQGHHIGRGTAAVEPSFQIITSEKAAWFLGLGNMWGFLDARPRSSCSAGHPEGGDDGPGGFSGAFLTVAVSMAPGSLR